VTGAPLERRWNAAWKKTRKALGCTMKVEYDFVLRLLESPGQVH